MKRGESFGWIGETSTPPKKDRIKVVLDAKRQRSIYWNFIANFRDPSVGRWYVQVKPQELGL